MLLFSDFLLSQNTFLSICFFGFFLSEVYKTVALCLFLSQTLARVPSQQSHLRSPKCCLAWRNWRSFHWWMKPMPRPQQAISPAPRRLLRNGAGSCLNVALRTSLSKVKKTNIPKSLSRNHHPHWKLWKHERFELGQERCREFVYRFVNVLHFVLQGAVSQEPFFTMHLVWWAAQTLGGRRVCPSPMAQQALKRAVVTALTSLMTTFRMMPSAPPPMSMNTQTQMTRWHTKKCSLC